MPDSNNFKLDLKLVVCSRCNNAFMVQRKTLDDTKELVCDNCIRLEKRKRELQISVMENVLKVENEMEASIVKMKNELSTNNSKFNKQFFLENIKKRAKALSKSVELLEKIEDSKDEKYIKEYIELFEEMKKDSST